MQHTISVLPEPSGPIINSIASIRHGDLQRALGIFLALDVGEVGSELVLAQKFVVLDICMGEISSSPRSGEQ